MLEPIWDLKPETARRLRGRIEAVLDYAREPDDSRPNPAAWSGWLKTKLGEQPKTKLDKKTGVRIPRGHHTAMRWQNVPVFVAKLRTMDSAASRALEFLILTASRTGEVIDMPGTRSSLFSRSIRRSSPHGHPSDRMKMDRDHHVSLSDRAVEILREQMARRSTSSFGDHPYVFEGERPRQGLSNMALLMIRANPAAFRTATSTSLKGLKDRGVVIAPVKVRPCAVGNNLLRATRSPFGTPQRRPCRESPQRGG